MEQPIKEKFIGFLKRKDFDGAKKLVEDLYEKDWYAAFELGKILLAEKMSV